MRIDTFNNMQTQTISPYKLKRALYFSENAKRHNYSLSLQQTTSKGFLNFWVAQNLHA